MAYKKVTEGTTSRVKVILRDQDGLPQSAAAGSWQVVDVESRTVMKASADLPAPIAVGTYILEIPCDSNDLVDPAHVAEYRRVTVQAQYGDDDAVNDEYIYQVCNLADVV